MAEKTIKKNSNCKSFSKGFRAKYARLMHELGYEEVIHRLNTEFKQLSNELQILTAMSIDVDGQRAALDQTFLKICADWKPRYPGDSVMNSELVKLYNESVEFMYDQANLRNERLVQLSRRIALISDALDVCDKMGRRAKKSHTA